MPRNQGSVAPGPQTIGRTTLSDRTRPQPLRALPSPSDLHGIIDDARKLRRDVLQAELRGRGNVEADQHMAWKQPEGGMRPPSRFGDTPGPSIFAHAGLSRGDSGSGDARQDAPNGFKDAPDMFDDPTDISDRAADGSSVAADGCNDAPARFDKAAEGYNVPRHELNGQAMTSQLVLFAGGSIGMDESVTALEGPPTSLSEDTNTLTTSLSGPGISGAASIDMGTGRAR